jgi:Ca-activated chloride channel homolog
MLYTFFKHINFAYPLVLLLFAFFPLLIWWYIKQHNRQQATMLVSTTKAFTVSSFKEKLSNLPFILRLLCLAALLVALARPQKRNESQRTEGEGIDIVLCMDISGSMGSGDIAPSRMEVAKEVAEEFVRSRPVDRIGLVVFAGESFTQSPITSDRNTVISQIQSLDSRPLLNGRLLKDGTVIGEGLATAVDRLAKITGKSKVIILITDGKEDAPETRLIDPLTALEIAKSKSVKVYTIGIGARPSTVTERSGAAKSKNPEIDFIDEALLNRIAVETGGQFFRAKDKQALQDTYQQIDKLEKTKVETIITAKQEEMFLPLILAALFFLFIEMLLKLTFLRRFP